MNILIETSYLIESLNIVVTMKKSITIELCLCSFYFFIFHPTNML